MPCHVASDTSTRLPYAGALYKHKRRVLVFSTARHSLSLQYPNMGEKCNPPSYPIFEMRYSESPKNAQNHDVTAYTQTLQASSQLPSCSSFFVPVNNEVRDTEGVEDTISRVLK